MDTDVSGEFERLTRFAQDIDGLTREFPERGEFILEGGRGYMKGALDVLASLRLISDSQHDDWLFRFEEELTRSSTSGGTAAT